ncbi:GTPase [Catenuloplanes sp. NPDC051500]|uniref:GTPase n=1 Tax=Catenuloplanes sp. NPDC051500 TaxID=3363959 RepID=UPI0037B56B59
MTAPSQEQIRDVIDQHRASLPTKRKPCVIVCGGIGAGKTTTINTLFGADVGAVGHFSRGTAQDELYEWESHGEHLDVVDLPGLGDTKERDREYRDMYRRRVEGAHGFIVVTTPPRPASLPTLRTVTLLLGCGVPAERIVIAFNRLSMLNVEIDGELMPVEMAGLGGPLDPEGRARVEEARAALLSDLRAGTRNHAFTLAQVVPYDALSGWNLYGVLGAVLAGLPGDTLPPWRDAVSTAAARAVEKQRKRSARERKHIAELEARIHQLTADEYRYFVRRKEVSEAGDRGSNETVKAAAAHERSISDRFGDAVTRWTGSRTAGDVARVAVSVFLGR